MKGATIAPFFMPQRHKPNHKRTAGIDVPQNLYSPQDIDAIHRRAAEIKAALATAGIGTLIQQMSETQARLEVVENHLRIALATNADLMIWHLQAVEQLNNIIAGKPAQAIVMPGLEDATKDLNGQD